MSTINLLQETIGELHERKYTPEHVSWVGTSDGAKALSWGDAVAVLDVEYDNGFGGAEIVENLVIVMNDGTWFSRGEYDGSEWWNYHRLPVRRDDSVGFLSPFNTYR